MCAITAAWKNSCRVVTEYRCTTSVTFGGVLARQEGWASDSWSVLSDGRHPWHTVVARAAIWVRALRERACPGAGVVYAVVAVVVRV